MFASFAKFFPYFYLQLETKEMRKKEENNSQIGFRIAKEFFFSVQIVKVIGVMVWSVNG